MKHKQIIVIKMLMTKLMKMMNLQILIQFWIKHDNQHLIQCLIKRDNLLLNIIHKKMTKLNNIIHKNMN